jgi:ribosome biogenesis GTPase / thiamine phosphate phosphatase
VLKAVENGELDRASYGNYLKMEKEKAYFESTVDERRRKEKIFGKIIKTYKKDIKSNKY